uniref:Arginine-hydroxylase NDUFAF5, mitochondrial n=1 Tax=Strongyloides stercoralis TaxID=6248 RepID=A0AAF5HY10_STRER
MSSELYYLPAELLINIFSKTHLKELLNLKKTCKKFYNLIYNNYGYMKKNKVYEMVITRSKNNDTEFCFNNNICYFTYNNNNEIINGKYYNNDIKSKEEFLNILKIFDTTNLYRLIVRNCNNMNIFDVLYHSFKSRSNVEVLFIYKFGDKDIKFFELFMKQLNNVKILEITKIFTSIKVEKLISSINLPISLSLESVNFSEKTILIWFFFKQQLDNTEACNHNDVSLSLYNISTDKNKLINTLNNIVFRLPGIVEYQMYFTSKDNLKYKILKNCIICNESPISMNVTMFNFRNLNVISLRIHNLNKPRFFSTPIISTVPANFHIFDRNVKKHQRNWSARQPEYNDVQYLHEEIGYRIADKVFDLTKFNEKVLDLGCLGGFISPHLIKENVGTIVQCDMSEELVKRSNVAPEEENIKVEKVVSDEELVNFEDNSFDLILSSCSAHWINDLPGWFKRCYNVLKEDCPFIGCMFYGDTLFELRVSLQLAEMERLGGIGAHISPFVQPQDISRIMNKAGFDMVTLDCDEIEIGYPNMFALMYDLQLMGESNASVNRSGSLRKDTLIAADAIYKTMYGKEDRYPATFQFMNFIGWKPGPNMPQPAIRGSQNVSLKDLGEIIEKGPENYIKK